MDPKWYPEGPSTQYLRIRVPKTILGMFFGTLNLEFWVLGPCGVEPLLSGHPPKGAAECRPPGRNISTSWSSSLGAVSCPDLWVDPTLTSTSGYLNLHHSLGSNTRESTFWILLLVWAAVIACIRIVLKWVLTLCPCVMAQIMIWLAL